MVQEPRNKNIELRYQRYSKICNPSMKKQGCLITTEGKIFKMEKIVQPIPRRLGGSNNIKDFCNIQQISSEIKKKTKKFEIQGFQYSTNQLKPKILSTDKPLVVLCSA